SLDEVLGLLQAQAGQLAHNLDDLDLLAAVTLEDDVELVLLLWCLSRSGRRGRAGGDGDRGGGLHVEGLLERLHELGELDQRHLLERVQQRVRGQLCHGCVLSILMTGSWAAAQAASLSRLSCSAASRRAAWVSGAWKVAAALLRLAFIAPASLASSTSRDS